MKLSAKLFIAFSVTALFAVTLLVGLWQWSLHRGYYQFISQLELPAIQEVQQSLLAHYRQYGSWDKLKRDPMAWRTFNKGGRKPAPPPDEHNFSQPPDKQKPPLGETWFNHQDTYHRVSVYDAQRQVIVGRNDINENPIIYPLILNDNTIGYVGLVPERSLEKGPDKEFLQQQLLMGLSSGLLTLLIALAVAYGIAQHFMRPIQRLIQGTDQLRQGNYDSSIQCKTGDEIQALADNFNSLAATLKQNKIHREEWVANIAHELRTPITILHSQLEAIIDGLFEPTTERHQLLKLEVTRLHRLVEDLYQLSLADSGSLNYRMTLLDPAEVLQEVCSINQSACLASGVTLSLINQLEEPCVILADPERIRQLFDNLIDNSRKYTDSPGAMQITLYKKIGVVCIRIEDSPPGVSSQDKLKLFERLYRVEKSRSREFGGSGLGLAICKTIVEAHQGEICCIDSALGGLGIEMSFPLREKDNHE